MVNRKHLGRGVLFFYFSFISAAAYAVGVRCTPPAVLWKSPSSFTYLPQGKTRFSHFSASNGTIPRLVYWLPKPQSQPGSQDRCDDLHIREGVASSYPYHSFGTSNDWQGTLASSAFPAFTCPKILDVALYQSSIAVTVADGRVTSLGTSPRLGTRLYLFDLLPQGQHTTPQEIMQGTVGAGGFGYDVLDAFLELKFDHEPADSQQGNPYLSWIQTQTNFIHWPLANMVSWPRIRSAGDRVYYCRKQSCGAAFPTNAGVTLAPFSQLLTHWVSDLAFQGPLPTYYYPWVQYGLAQKKWSTYPSGQSWSYFDEGIYQVGSTLSPNPGIPSAWLDEISGTGGYTYFKYETPAEHFRTFGFYMAHNASFQKRLHIGDLYNPPTTGGYPFLVEHDPQLSDGEDTNFILSQNPGLSTLSASAPLAYYPDNRFFGFESHDGQSFLYSNPQLGLDSGVYMSSDLMIGSIATFGQLVSYRSLMAQMTPALNIPNDIYFFMHGVSENFFIASAIPNSEHYSPADMDIFVGPNETSLAFYFFCID